MLNKMGTMDTIQMAGRSRCRHRPRGHHDTDVDGCNMPNTTMKMTISIVLLALSPLLITDDVDFCNGDNDADVDHDIDDIVTTSIVF